jgi:hypothetical protein
VAAAAAVGAWWAARSSTQASEAMTSIERHRWHADLTPQFELTRRVTSGERAELRVALFGPAGLDRLDRVALHIRDDIPGRAPATPGEPTAEEIPRQIWGPYRFVPGVDGADQTGRRVAPFALLQGNWRPLALERTRRPELATDPVGWRRQYNDQPVRLTLARVREGEEPWTVPLEVQVERSQVVAVALRVPVNVVAVWSQSSTQTPVSRPAKGC